MIAELAIGIIVIALIAVGWHFSNVIIHPEHHTREALYIADCENGRIPQESYEQWPRQAVEIQSQYGYPLKGLWFPLDGSEKTAIICHGITANLSTSIKYMILYRRRGFNILIYDHRNHGDSGGKTTTYGYYEKHDLKSWVDWVQEKCGKDCLIGTHGESMGAGIILQHLAIDDRIAFTVADCGFSDLYELFAFRCRADYHIPPFPLLNIADIITWLRTGMKFSGVSPIRDLQNETRPILFVHGAEDTYVPTFMSKKMYEQRPENRMLYIAPNAAHVGSFSEDPIRYDQEVEMLLEKIGVVV